MPRGKERTRQQSCHGILAAALVRARWPPPRSGWPVPGRGPCPPPPPRLPSRLEPAELGEGRLTGVAISDAGPLGDGVRSLDLDEARATIATEGVKA